jgi:excisionase family DNA binding protein
VKTKLLTTRQVAETAGIHRDTLLRWLREGRIKEPARDRNGWRVFSTSEVNKIVKYSENTSTKTLIAEEPELKYSFSKKISRLKEVNWDFADSSTNYLTHSIHPYPAKFIPQIPKTLIRELASTGDTVLDPFCGSGTTLVEALRLECNAIGIDANPLSCLISKTKTSTLTESQGDELYALAEVISEFSSRNDLASYPLFGKNSTFPLPINRHFFKGIDEWFDAHVINELSFIKDRCNSVNDPKLRDILLTVLSSIIVSVSRQDSDTRYVRREKKIKQGDTLVLYGKSLRNTTRKILEYTQEVSDRNSIKILNASVLDSPDIGKIDLVVCSPPYPNAYSYHLYHRTRMMWLDMDQPKFKKEEIGSHRKYSSNSKNGATVETFKAELKIILEWLTKTLKKDGFACFVIGDSTLKGKQIENDKVLINIANDLGFALEANINRNLLSTKKYFNPALGKIRDEHIVILRNKF